MAYQVEKTTTIGEVVNTHPEVAPILMEIGMHCLGCPASQMESVSDAHLHRENLWKKQQWFTELTSNY